jgi:hypothetical protein
MDPQKGPALSRHPQNPAKKKPFNENYCFELICRVKGKQMNNFLVFFMTLENVSFMIQKSDE